MVDHGSDAGSSSRPSSPEGGAQHTDPFWPRGIGRERLGRYVLYRLLGRGGMASVYLGRMVGERGFERWVAVKRIHEHLLTNDHARTMFLDEARTAARLSHPNVVQVTDFGLVGDLPYIVMEYVNGETLSGLLRACRRTERRLPVALAARIVAWACEGLHHAHELLSRNGQPLGLVHRDVSPQNILISYDGAVKVSDFGIAKAAGRMAQTRTGQVKGKTAYMSPEQVLSQPLDRRSDIFALGIVLFEATTGRRLFRRESELETMQRISNAVFQPPSNVDPRYPPDLEEIVLKALQLSADDRYQTAREMQRDVEKYLSSVGEPIGTAELNELMESLFSENIKLTREMLAAAPAIEPDIPIEVTEVSPTTLSLPEATGEELRLRRQRNLTVAAAAAVLLVALVVGSWSLLRGDETGDSVAEASTVSSSEAPSATSDTSLASGADAGRRGSPRPRVIDLSAVDPDASRSSEGDAGPSQRSDARARPRPKRQAGKRPRRPPPAGPPGRVSIIADPWCDVYLGGTRLGRTPILGRSVPSGRHVLRFMPQGKGPAVRRVVVVRPGEESPVSVRLSE